MTPQRATERGNDPLKPDANLMILLGSALVHLEEFAETGEPHDLHAAQSILTQPEVIAWREAMGPLLPLKRDRP